MKIRSVHVCLLCALGALLVAAVLARALLLGRRETIDEYTTEKRAARISPDYADVVMPPNIAPLNFVVKEPGAGYCVRISAARGKTIEVFSRSGKIVIPPGPWRALLEANRGGRLAFDVYVKTAAGKWRRFAPLTGGIANEDINPYLVYRKMPVYNLVWRDMGIYQRNLETYSESVILRNRSFGHGCVNCHTFLGNLPDRMVMNVRGPESGAPPGGMVIAKGNAVRSVVDTKTPFNAIPAIYLAWHPSGKVISFSTNKVLQCFHTVGDNRSVVDRFSDVALYLLDSNTVTTIPELSRLDRLETYPTWSPDGRHMYFCSAPKLPIAEYENIRYDLMRIPYDVNSGAWGKLETVLPAGKAGLSVALPRFSPDGKFLLFCMSEYGNFPAFSASSDLYMMDVKTGRYERLEINSDKADAYHSWSSNSRWIVFSSKRRDGLFARPYLSYIDGKGKAHKPVLLPQKDPAFYDSFVRVYNVPELIREPVGLTRRELARALHSPEKRVKAKLDPRVKPRRYDDGTQTEEWKARKDSIQ